MTDDFRPDRPRQDNAPPHAPAPGDWHLKDDLVLGLRFFSRLPSGDSPHVAPNLDRIAYGLGFTSVVIGFLPALLLMLCCWAGMPGFVAAVLAVTALALVTGAMAEDAIADSADGLVGGSTIERRLEIMKDSRHGTYGVVAIIAYFGLRVAALGSIAAVNPLAAGAIWLGAGVIARSGSLWLSLDLSNAREGGASAAAGRVSARGFWIGLGFALLIGFMLTAPFTSVVVVILALLVALLVAIGWSRICLRLVGGQTGDLIGALQALLEMALIAVLVTFA